jgi:pantetheine-phosphate adenylyltransferase/16S rRNA (guanine(966)-N(2))-methyltransferase RsmD
VRIIAGRFKGRRLAGPAGPGLRPTSDALRETLFNVLGPSVADARVLDGFAGTGALGLEALSRGARAVTFVEPDRRALTVLGRNVATCGVADACAIIRDDLLALAARRALDGRFDLVLLDPPYDSADLEAVVRAAAPLVAPAGRLVLEHSRRRPSPEAAGSLERTRVVRAGDSALSFYAGESASAQDSMAQAPRIAVFPGSFDPLTNGHVDVVRRALRLFDAVVVAILVNPSKQSLFTLEDRVAMARDVLGGTPGVDVDTFEGLLTDYARRRHARAVVRGLRGNADFEYERQMALMNRHLYEDVETVFILPSQAYEHISSTLVREIAALGGPLDGLVPPAVAARFSHRHQRAVSRRV